MIPTIVDYPHVEWCELVQWLTDEMNKSGEYNTDFYYVGICLNTYIADSVAYPVLLFRIRKKYQELRYQPKYDR